VRDVQQVLLQLPLLLLQALHLFLLLLGCFIGVRVSVRVRVCACVCIACVCIACACVACRGRQLLLHLGQPPLNLHSLKEAHLWWVRMWLWCVAHSHGTHSWG
jgi:hypothetical protein